jgi:hypothetical protein
VPNEIHADYTTGATLYATRFQPDGNVFVTSGSSDQVWSDPTLYNVTMTENGDGGHYEGDFDASGNIVAGVYQITIFLQTGATPANGDPQLYKGEIYWDGTEEINLFTLDEKIVEVFDSQAKQLNVYEVGE